MFTNQPRKLNPRLRKRCDYSVKQDQRNGVHVVGTSNASTNACRTARAMSCRQTRQGCSNLDHPRLRAQMRGYSGWSCNISSRASVSVRGWGAHTTSTPCNESTATGRDLKWARHFTAIILLAPCSAAKSTLYHAAGSYSGLT
jgi:hypothetical protein